MRYGYYCNIADSGYNSCYGDSLDVVAPGIHVPTTTINGGYTRVFGGTSSAAPHVAGVAALVLSVNPCLTREEVKYVIESTCTKIRPDLYVYGNDPNHPNGTWNIEVGYGLVNAYAAVQLAQQLGGYTYIKDTVITGNIVWTGNKMIHDSLVVDSLATLTVTDTVYMSSKARLIVRPGGKLVIDGGTLTSACPGEMWQGIEVMGDRTKRQIPQWQGTVELRDSAVIENAFCAIRTGLRGDTVNFATTGGIIIADSAYFTNNLRAVEINSYTNHSPAGTVTDNVCSFERCTFTVDSSNLFAANGTAFTEHVKLWDVRGVKFRGCTFQNKTVSPVSNGRGVYAEDAGVKVRTACASYLPTIDCECHDNPRKSVFSGFTTAVEVNTTGNQFAVTVDEAQFENNTTGVRVNGNQFVTVTRNTFNLLTAPGNGSYICGLKLDNSTGYKVEGNRFIGMDSYVPGISRGIWVNNSNSGANRLYRNSFKGLHHGIYATGDNGGQTKYGLQLICNTFNASATTALCFITRMASSSIWPFASLMDTRVR